MVICNTDVSGTEEAAGEMQILLHNPYSLKLPPERLAAQILGLSRNQAKRELELRQLEILQESDTIQIMIKGEKKFAFGNRETYHSQFAGE